MDWYRVSSCVVVLAASLAGAVRASPASRDIAVIRERYVAQLTGRPPGEGTVRKYMKSLKPDGTWPDINYRDKNRSAWKPMNHVRRIEQIAKAYAAKGHGLAGDRALKDCVNRALAHWLEKDYTAPNWWHNKIGTPMAMANALVLMGGAVPQDKVQRALDTSLKRAQIGMTGQNKVWLASIVFTRCLIDGNEELLNKAIDVVLSEIRVTTKEGVQPDWSFHQHGPQQQFGNYGGAFGSSATTWALLLKGTSFALTDRQVEVLRSYLLEGSSWILWNGRMDISGCGRQVFRGCQASKGRGTMGQLRRLIEIDPESRRACELRLDSCDPNKKNLLVGTKHFWRSDMTVHRRPGWYASVKMSSERVIGSETCNSENMRGLHLGDGAMYVYLTGNEYEDIQPFWDWKRLPGTTCDQSLTKLVPNSKRCRLPVQFVGGATDGECAVTAMVYKRGSLTARKSYFLDEGAVVLMGRGVSGSDSGEVLTSIQQSLLRGPVVVNGRKVDAGTHELASGDWVHHAGIGYHLKCDRAVLRIGRQEGNWRDIFTTRPSSPQAGDVFSLWVDHGKKPNDGEYLCVLYPEVDAARMSAIVKADPVEFPKSTRGIHAIAVHRARRVAAVFFEPGRVQLSDGTTVEADTPCLVCMSRSAGAWSVHVSEPTQKKERLALRVDGRPVVINLPRGGDAGKTVTRSTKARAAQSTSTQSTPTEHQETRPARRAPIAGAVEEYDRMLRARLKEHCGGGGTATLQLSSLGRRATVRGITDVGGLDLEMRGAKLTLAWPRLTLADRRRLATEVARDGNEADHCIVAFYALANGDEREARDALARCGDLAGAVEGFFKQK